MENKVTISELPELFNVSGAESIPVDSYDQAQAKNKTFRVSVETIRNFVESGLVGGAITPEQILAWDNKETTQGAIDKVDAGLASAKEYTDQELVAVKTAISELEDILASEDVDLDELQEIVDFIKLNRSDLDSLTTASIAGLDDALELKADVSDLEDKADVSDLELKADVKNSFEVVTADKTIVNADAGKILYITEDCILTVSDYDSLDDGFNCKIIVDAGAETVAVAFAESDSVRGDHTEITEDTTLIKSPNDGVFVFFGK